MMATLHYEKKGVLQLTLQLNFLVASNTCNSPCLYVVNVIRQITIVTRVTTHHIYGATHYNSSTTHFQLLCNSPMTTIIMSC